MIKAVIKSAAILAIACSISLNLGCSRSGQKMKVPDIKMITRENLHCVIAPDDNNIWLTGAFGTIYHSADGGRNWSPQESGEKQTILCEGMFLDNRTGWVVGINGTILHTTDGGARWTRQNTGTKRHLFGIFFADKNNG